MLNTRTWCDDALDLWLIAAVAAACSDEPPTRRAMHISALSKRCEMSVTSWRYPCGPPAFRRPVPKTFTSPHWRVSVRTTLRAAAVGVYTLHDRGPRLA